MSRRARAWWLALAGSLLLHAALMSWPGLQLLQWQTTPEPRPFDVQLQPQASREDARTSVALPAPPARPRSVPAVAAAAPPAPESPAELPPPVAVAVAPAEVSATEIESRPTAPPAVDTEAAVSSLNALPPRLELRFAVGYGLASGEQTLLWLDEGGRYTLTSVASATGLAGVFYRGRFVQTSRGRITSRGLVPEEFWDQRGDKRSSARFDHANGTLTLTTSQGAPRHFPFEGEVQDALSLFFQFALTAPPAAEQLAYTVFNGRKLRTYAYEVRGEETLDTALGALRTLHLTRQAGSDGRFEIWLAVDRHYLPVRVLKSDDKGNEMELVLRAMQP